MKSTERRRSNRLMLTVPLRIQGTDSNGNSFHDDARSITLNRHGARIQTSRPLRTGQILRLSNLVGHREADFRVVGPLSPATEKGGEWGVECLSSKENIWAIQFPPPADGDSTESTALLECRKCHTVALLPVSLVEAEVLETSGILTRECDHCRVFTFWGYAEKQVAMGGPAESEMAAEAQAVVRTLVPGADQRRHRRVTLQLPVFVRDYYGGVEISKSENVSRGGFCFASEKGYLVGQGIMVVCPYNSTNQGLEMRARVVRRREIEGTQRKVYGVRYDPQSG
jgi:hypothetical protein